MDVGQVVLQSHQAQMWFNLKLKARQQLLFDHVAQLGEEAPQHLKTDMQLELKRLKLIELQQKVRNEVLAYDGPQTPIDRSFYRRARAPLLPSEKLSPLIEKKLDKEQVKLEERRSFLEAVRNHHANFRVHYQTHLKSVTRINRSVLTYHRDRERKRRQEEDKTRRERLKALRENNEDAYIELVKNTKNERLTQLLSQTDEYLSQIGARVAHEREKAMDFKSRHELSQAKAEKTTEQKPADNNKQTAEKDERKSKVGSTQPRKNYYLHAHRIQEAITTQPTCLIGGNLKKYQMEGLEWLVSLYNNGLNGILADEMGLGKTIQSIALLAHLAEVKRNAGPFLVVVPLSTLPNWKLEFQRWCPSLKVVIYRDNKDGLRRLERNKLSDPGSYNAVVTTYEMVLRSAFLRRTRWQYLIVDEGHRLKNSQCKLFKTLSAFTTRHRLLLTGTPLQNSLDELWALLNFLLPRIFSSCVNFEEWFNAPFIDKGATSERLEMEEEETLLVINRLHQVLRPFVLRREKKEVLDQLPAKKEIVIRCHTSAWQQIVYHGIQSKAMTFVDPKSKKLRASTLSNTIMQLRKVCNHPLLVNIDHDYTYDELVRSSGKFELLDRMLPKLIRTGHKVLLFSQMTKLLDLLEDYLDTKGIAFIRLDGSTKPEERGEAVRKFSQEGSKLNLFLLSTRAGGLGLNLQVADTVILYDSDWNPQQDLQAQDRAHRIGQQSEVRVFRFVTATPVEESMYDRALRKLDMDAKIIQAGKFNSSYSEEDRQEHLSLLLSEKTTAESQAEVPDHDALNRLLARSDDEFTMFQELDKDIEAEREKDWKTNFPGRPFPKRLMEKKELPKWLTLQPPPQEDNKEASNQEARGKRKRRKVVYDDGLSDLQFDKLINSDVPQEGESDGEESLGAGALKDLNKGSKRKKRKTRQTKKVRSHVDEDYHEDEETDEEWVGSNEDE